MNQLAGLALLAGLEQPALAVQAVRADYLAGVVRHGAGSISSADLAASMCRSSTLSWNKP